MRASTSERRIHTMSARTAGWSPYGLEAHRVALLRKRQRLLAAGILLGLLVLAGILVNSIRTQDEVNAFNGDAGRVNLDRPDAIRSKPTTLTVSPGRTSVLQQPLQEERAPRPATAPLSDSEKGAINWMGVLSSFAPPLGLALVAWRYGKGKLTHGLDEVNLGVYKGALPYEMHTAHHKKYVFTRDLARAHLFGKGPSDMLPQQPLVLRRSPLPPPKTARPR